MATDKTIPNIQEIDLRKLALAIADNEIFGSWMIREGDMESMLRSIFMVLLFMDEPLPDNVAHFYEYYSESSPMGINGYPIFMSLKMINAHDWQNLAPLVNELIEQKDKFINGHG